MLHKFCEKTASYFFDNDCDYPLEVYTYGIELVVSSLIGTALIFCLGLIIGRFFEAVVYVVTLIAVRSFSGGYHARSYLKCNIIYIAAFVVSVFLNDLIIYRFNFAKYYIYGFMLLSVLIVLILFAPVENENKKVDSDDRLKFKIIPIIMVLIFSAFAILVNTVIGKVEPLIVFPVLCVVEVSMLFDIFMKKGGTKYEISKDNNKENC